MRFRSSLLRFISAQVLLLRKSVAAGTNPVLLVNTVYVPLWRSIWHTLVPALSKCSRVTADQDDLRRLEQCLGAIDIIDAMWVAEDEHTGDTFGWPRSLRHNVSFFDDEFVMALSALGPADAVKKYVRVCHPKT